MSWRNALCAGLVVAAAVGGAARGEEKKEDKKPSEVLKISVVQPKDDPSLAQVNGGRYVFEVKLENAGKEDLVLWPYLTAEVQDAEGNRVKPSRYIGRFGVR